ncbi:MAG: Holliday junction resolvase RuvX, partial [Acidimicrobiia bacterium]
NADRAVEEVVRMVSEHEVELIVVGLPVTLSGGEGESAGGARRLAARVSEATGLPVELVDERFTTHTAERAMLAAGEKRRRRRADLDKVAAAVILQHYLDGRR